MTYLMKSITSSTASLRPFWEHFFRYDWRFGLFLILLFGIPRFLLVLHANVTGGFNTAFIIFLLMWFTPMVFLSRRGRKEIGLRRPRRLLWLAVSFLAGAVCSFIIFGMFGWLFSDPVNQPLNYIAGTGAVPAEISDSDRLTYFIIASVPSMLFSPIGEELLYRGVIHGSFTGKSGETKASVFDSLAFAITHLSHFGIMYQSGHWHFLPLPALLWIMFMFMASQVFFRCKQIAGSIYGAVFSHAGFNLAMMYLIFYGPF